MQRLFNKLFLIILTIAALALVWLGGHLLILGGSPWYLLSGLWMFAAAVLGWRRAATAVPLYWAFLAADVVWALWESGFDGWALAPRLAMPLCMGLYMLTPGFGVTSAATLHFRQRACSGPPSP